MSRGGKKTLNCTSAIARQPVRETCNPDVSGFRNYLRGGAMTDWEPDSALQAGEGRVGTERLHHATQVLMAKGPTRGK